MNKTDEFLRDICSLFRSEIPEYVLNKTRYSLLDYIGVTLAGRVALQEKLDQYLNLSDPGNSTAIGLDRKLCLKDAVFLNGLNAHALDLDDGTNTGIIHLGSPIFSALLPLAERYGVSFERFLMAVVIGYEASFTMAVSIQPEHKAMGYHATGTCGILGVALAISYLLGFSEKDTKNAFATACISATGMLQALDDGSELKPYNVAKTALLGLISAQMAQAGFSGNPDPLGNYRGYLKLFTGDENTDIKKPLLGGTYAIEKTYVKPYAACRYCHPSIEAAIRLRNQYEIQPDKIASVSVQTYDLAVNGHNHRKILGTASAKMSIPYSVAVALIDGNAGIWQFDASHIRNEAILNLAGKVDVAEDDEISRQFPQFTSATVIVRMTDGKEYGMKVDFPKGEPENPLSEQEFKERFLQLAVYGGKTRKSAVELFQTVMRLTGIMDILFPALTRENAV